MPFLNNPTTGFCTVHRDKNQENENILVNDLIKIIYLKLNFKKPY